MASVTVGTTPVLAIKAGTSKLLVIQNNSSVGMAVGINDSAVTYAAGEHAGLVVPPGGIWSLDSVKDVYYAGGFNIYVV